MVPPGSSQQKAVQQSHPMLIDIFTSGTSFQSHSQGQYVEAVTLGQKIGMFATSLQSENGFPE
jgi:hypothetical protein